MHQKIKSVALATMLGVSMLTVAPVVQAQTGAESGTDITGQCTQWQIDQGLCESGLRTLILKIINWILLFLGLVATGFLIYGGFMYITSAGNEQNVDKAKKVIMYAAIGIIIIVLAAVLVNALVDIVSSNRTDNQ
jgi:heme/copper-type cytochrome/quinol oxidase subunit 2